MNTLQLYISKSGDGAQTRLAEINATDEGRRAATDMKAAVALVDYPASAKAVFFVVVNLSDGYAIHVIRTIPPVRPNHLDATIYVDKHLDVMAEDLAEVLNKVREIVLAKAVTESDMAELRRLFAREYDLRDKAPRIKPSRGRDFALLNYGAESDRSLADIIDAGIYLPEWSEFKGVILLDDTLSTYPNSVVDLDYAEEEDEEVYDEEPEEDNPQSRSKSHTYVFALPVVLPEGKSNLEFELETSKRLNYCPVPGYEVVGMMVEGEDKCNKLRRAKGKTLYQRLERWIWGFGGVIVGIILMAIAGLFKSSSPAETAEPQAVYKSNSAAATTVRSEAVLYLDNNRIWRRDEMEKIDGLSGLFDDLNNYRFEEITGKWAETLSSSENFTKVIQAAKNSVAKKKDPLRAEEHNPRYNREDDTAIGWLVYTYWIDP